MKILLIAYEYAPIGSAQSIRWHYLSEELHKKGHQLDVLAPEYFVPSTIALDEPDGVKIHRSFAGPYVGMSTQKHLRKQKQIAKIAVIETVLPEKTEITFAQRVYRAGRRVLDIILYPDLRTEWYFSARKKLDELIEREKYDVIVASHEPAVSLFLAAYAKKKYGIRAVADLGDPLATVYSPKWRYKFDEFIEKKLTCYLDHLFVTTDTFKKLLNRKHQISVEKVTVVPQGFRRGRCTIPTLRVKKLFEPFREKFTLTFTGNFYRDFRNPEHLFRAVERVPNVVLIIVGSAQKFEAPANVHFLPRLSHLECLYLQERSSMLLNLGNAQVEQIPGKLLEYIGAKRPIFHIYEQEDFGKQLIDENFFGEVTINDVEEIYLLIKKVFKMHCAGELDDRYNLDDSSVSDFEWGNISEKLLSALLKK